MALVLSKKTTRKIKVEAVEPGDLTASTKHQFTAEFKIIPADDWKNLVEQDESVHEVVKRGLIGVEGIKDESGNDVSFDDSLVDALLAEPWVLNPLFKAQLAVQGGLTQTELYKAAKRKN